jgi:ribosomal protein L24
MIKIVLSFVLLLISCGEVRRNDINPYMDSASDSITKNAVEVLSDSVNIDSIKNVFKQREELIIEQEMEIKTKDVQITKVKKQLELEQTKLQKLNTIINDSVETDSIN